MEHTPTPTPTPLFSPSPLLRLPSEVLHELAIHLLLISASPDLVKDPGIGHPAHDIPDILDTPCDSCASASTSSSSSSSAPISSPNDPPKCRYCPPPPVPITFPHPQHLLPLLLTCRTLNNALKLEGNESLYQQLYFETFDSAAVLRRYHRGPPTLSAALAYHSDRERRKRKGKGKSRESSSSHSMSITQLLSPTEDFDRWIPPNSPKLHDPLRSEPFRSFDLIGDPVPLAIEYRERFAMFRRLRLCVMFKNLDVNGSKSLLEGDLWSIWLMITENDGRNILILHALAYLHAFLLLMLQHVYLKDALSPGYPEDTVEKSIVTWIASRVGDGKGEATNEQVDEKVFVLKPYVFACHKYPVHLAPWIFRVLPLTEAARDHNELTLMSRPNPFMADLSPQKMSVPVWRFGREYEVVPFPFNSDGCAVIYANTVARHPRMSGTTREMDFGVVGSPPIFDFAQDSQFSKLQQYYASTAPVISKTKSLVVSSLDFDPDLMRAMKCCNPIDSPGLPPLFYRNSFQGHWDGKYLFMDFPAYRSLLSGNIRSLYDGACGEMQQDFFLEESVINIREDLVGGSGSVLTAGFNLSSQTAEAQLAEASLSTEERGWEPCLDESAPCKPGWTKEIILSGRGRSSWGWCTIRGRVRSWDGMVILVNEYDVPAVGKFHWRGYVHAGGAMVGRWRDTWTKENMRGYEGPFVMYRVGTPLHNRREIASFIIARDKPKQQPEASSSTATTPTDPQPTVQPRGPTSLPTQRPMDVNGKRTEPADPNKRAMAPIWHPFGGFKQLELQKASASTSPESGKRAMSLSRLAAVLGPELTPTPTYHSQAVREAFSSYDPVTSREGKKREADEVVQNITAKKNRPW